MIVACTYCGGSGRIYWSALVGVPARTESCPACRYRRHATYARLRTLAEAVQAALACSG